MKLDLSIKTICSLTNGGFIDSKGMFQNQIIQNIVIDSRSPLINAGSLFVILKGNKTSGEAFVSDFHAKNGGVILTAKMIPNSKVGQIVVEDPLRALQKIARYHREKFDIPVIGITGSNGKTTVKEWLYHVLKNNYNIVRSPKSYNSQIGVALSVLEICDQHELAIFEAGISQADEMVYLEQMIQPTIGVFTGIGDAHNNGFKGANPEEEKKKEKWLLFNNVKKLIVREKEDLSTLVKETLVNYDFSIDQYRLKIKNDTSIVELKVPFNDTASISNIAIVALVSKLLGIEFKVIEPLISTLPIISMRLEKMLGKSDTILINDAYNLDEKSLEIGIQFLVDNCEGKATSIVIAEHTIGVNSYTSLLNTIKEIQPKTAITNVIYIGESEVASDFQFITKHYNTVADYLAHPFAFSDMAILFTGPRSMQLEKVVNYYTEKKHITRLLINLDSVRKNLNVFRNKITDETRILAMVKAQSYGGGILEMAKFLEKENVDYFGVAYADEGVLLRKGGIKKPILVMNPEPAAFDDIIDYDLEPSIYSLPLLNSFIHQLILRQKKHFPIHIKLETGMNRLGFRDEGFRELLDTLLAQPDVYVRSVFSHLAVADDPKEYDFTSLQIERFNADSLFLENTLGYSVIKHIVNSAGAYHYPEAHFDMIRLGIGLFGSLEDEEIADGEFENVLQLCSQISQTRVIQPEENVGYGRHFKAEKETRIGVVPVGYADGLKRALGNYNWRVVIEGKKYPIIGNICMDMCMVDLGDDDIQVGAEVQLFGKENSLLEMSKKLNTIPYEIMSTISSRVQRVYLEE